MGTTTTTFALNKPTVGGDDNAWGGDWNSNADKLDDLLDGTTGITPNLIAGWEVGGVAVTSTAAELNILDGVTASTAEINILDGVTASTAELNILDGVTASTAELNILDGVTATTAELNFVDGVTSAIQTQLDAKAASSAGAPSGAVAHFAMNTAPTGWLKANGAAVSRTTYSDLFTAIGTTFGAGDGSTTFNLPDLRGRFTRNWSDGGGIDSGRVFGSTQATRVNNIEVVNSDSGGAYGTFIVNDDGTTSSRAYTGSTSGTGLGLTFTKKGGDTYPNNIALLACIKF